MSGNKAGPWGIKMKIIPIINELKKQNIALGGLRHIKK